MEPVLANLLELYTHDFTEFEALPLGSDGRFGYPSLPNYWSDPNRYPFLIRVDGELAGFAFATRGSMVDGDPDVWDVTEFFVVRGRRRNGVGMTAAHDLWRRFPGRWEVRVRPDNLPALAFWKRAVALFTGRAVEPDMEAVNGAGRLVFRFASTP